MAGKAAKQPEKPKQDPANKLARPSRVAGQKERRKPMTEQLRIAIEEIDIEIANAPNAQSKLLLLAMRKRIMDRVCEKGGES
jgi:hypothetical protein